MILKMVKPHHKKLKWYIYKKLHCLTLLIFVLLYTISLQTSSTAECPSAQSCESEKLKENYFPLTIKRARRKSEINDCVLTPETTDGPFFLPDQPIRSDITEGKEGIPFEITFIIKDIKTCKPVEGASVHLWQADALGKYSAYSAYFPIGYITTGIKSFFGFFRTGRIITRHAPPTEKGTFLRGIQNTDQNGIAKFISIFPGWYKQRATHIHFKVSIGKDFKYVGENYFPDRLTDEVSKVEPYKNNRGPGRKIVNPEDWRFLVENGKTLVMNPVGNVHDGFKGTMNIVIDA